MATITHYHKTIRKINAAFASLFTNVVLIRETQEGVENQRIIVPIEYGDGEKYVKRLRGDPDMMKKTQIVLPRMSYEMVGFNYDTSRKLITNNKNFAPSSAGGASALSTYNPVPYDFIFNLTIYVRNVEDGNQIIEQIVPYFTPDYTLRLNLVPEMGIIKNIPIVLDRVEQSIESDGDFGSEVRIVVWSLTFTAKAYIFSAVKDAKLISNTSINMINSSASGGAFASFDAEGACCTGNMSKIFKMLSTGNGSYAKGEIVYQGQSLDYAYASGKVSEWDSSSNTIIISSICGNFKLNQPIVGTDTLSIFVPYETANNNIMTQITVKPEPANANANTYFTANVVYNRVT